MPHPSNRLKPRRLTAIALERLSEGSGSKSFIKRRPCARDVPDHVPDKPLEAVSDVLVCAKQPLTDAERFPLTAPTAPYPGGIQLCGWAGRDQERDGQSCSPAQPQPWHGALREVRRICETPGNGATALRPVSVGAQPVSPLILRPLFGHRTPPSATEQSQCLRRDSQRPEGRSPPRRRVACTLQR